jgi:hypothetical protein
MKPRNREINIFNMSLLDVLCGALGTFCFMMIVLFPYYSAKPTNAPDVPKDMVDPKDMQQALDQIKQLKDALQKMENYAKGLEGQINQLKQQIEQLNQNAAKVNDHVGNLEMRNPFLGLMKFNTFSDDDDTEVFWVSNRISNNQKEPVKTDPTRHQGGFFGDLQTFGKGSSIAYHAIRDCPAGPYHLVLKIIKHDPAKPPISGWMVVELADWRYNGPVIKTNMAQGIVPLATVDMGPAPDYNYKFTWDIPKEVIDDPDWKPSFPDRGKQK